MALPLILVAVAVAAGAKGATDGVQGGVKIKKASDTMKVAKEKQETAIALFKSVNESTVSLMDKVGETEMKILDTFDDFSNLIEKMQGRPKFEKIEKAGVVIEEYKAEELKNVSAGAGLLLGGLGGSAAGTAGGFAAAGATTSAVMALGTASTGTAIGSLSGVAATNATLAALGGGAVAAGGGGMALGTMVLGGATLGIGLLVGGIIFNKTGEHLSQKADEALEQANKTEKEVNNIVAYLEELSQYANKFYDSLVLVKNSYDKHIELLDHIINFNEKTQWNEFTQKEKITTENAIMLVGLMYKMCKTKLVLKDTNENGINEVNIKDIDETIADSNKMMLEINKE